MTATPVSTENRNINAWLEQLEALPVDATALKAHLRKLHETLEHAFHAQVDIDLLVSQLTLGMDRVLTKVWQSIGPANTPDCALVAVGGYGRAELHPGSDIDLLVLLENQVDEKTGEKISAFLTFLWDLQLDIGHSVRSLEDCNEKGAEDLTIATALFESRLINGPSDLFSRLSFQLNQPGFWPSRAFYTAKVTEQRKRHTRFGDTAYRLEPNIKESPGGLRDVQNLNWIMTRHFGVDDISELTSQGFVTEEEVELINSARRFLWRVRFGLHLHAGRKEDRLLLDFQKSMAENFGYSDKNTNLAVEQFMQLYYRVATDVQRLNEMFLQLFEEEISLQNILSPPVTLNERFQMRGGYVEIVTPQVFERYPAALLEIFLLLQKNPEAMGVRATTIRAIRASLDFIDDDFRSNPICRELFMEILSRRSGVYHQLKRMNTYGVLAAYVPAFGRIVGRMQFDLYHAYTVDQHTIMVLRYARRLAVEKYADEIPLCSKIVNNIRRPVLLYLAALFHDIAKGRGGDHSELGAVDAREFCELHDLPEIDADLVVWLVRNHLQMSLVAQRKDISDPDVINEFAKHVASKERLDYLYLLTTADIRGTAPDLWTNWKAGLLAELHRNTAAALKHKDASYKYLNDLLTTGEVALQKLQHQSIQESDILAFWGTLGAEYFRQQSGDSIAWHTEELFQMDEKDAELHVAVRAVGEYGSTEILIFSPSSPTAFRKAAQRITQLGLDILGAGVYSTEDDKVINVFNVLERDNQPCEDHHRIEEIRERMLDAMLHATENETLPIEVTLKRQLRSFDSPLRVKFENPENKSFTELTIFAADRPGLLADIAEALEECLVSIKRAFIATVSEEAQDILHIINIDDSALSDGQQEQLRRHLLDVLQDGTPVSE